MLNLPPLSLYIHIPWCAQKCYYCDFNAYLLKGKIPHREYISHLLIDLQYDIPLTSGRTVNTIFIGGGTPSLLSSSAMRLLLYGVSQRLPLAHDVEITIEANPGNIKMDCLADYQLAGVNRISIGVQSFVPKQLTNLGCIHSADDAIHTARLLATSSLWSFNIDLMHGLPDQSLESALNDLTKAITLMPPHLSWYQLIIEPQTLLSLQPLKLPDDDTLWEIQYQGNTLLRKLGYHQYEISTYALPGFQCRHNLNYWRFGDYIGIGCGAHGKLTQSNGMVLRTVKTRHPRGYMGSNYVAQRYYVDSSELPLEYFMNRFRLSEEVPRAEFTAFTGLTENVVRSALECALSSDYITENDTYWQVTEKGKLFLNSLLELFIQN